MHERFLHRTSVAGEGVDALDVDVERGIEHGDEVCAASAGSLSRSRRTSDTELLVDLVRRPLLAPALETRDDRQARCRLGPSRRGAPREVARKVGLIDGEHADLAGARSVEQGGKSRHIAGVEELRRQWDRPACAPLPCDPSYCGPVCGPSPSPDGRACAYASALAFLARRSRTAAVRETRASRVRQSRRRRRTEQRATNAPGRGSVRDSAPGQPCCT